MERGRMSPWRRDSPHDRSLGGVTKVVVCFCNKGLASHGLKNNVLWSSVYLTRYAVDLIIINIARQTPEFSFSIYIWIPRTFSPYPCHHFFFFWFSLINIYSVYVTHYTIKHNYNYYCYKNTYSLTQSWLETSITSSNSYKILFCKIIKPNSLKSNANRFNVSVDVISHVSHGNW